MPALKCIGGPLDGQKFKLDIKCRQGDAVRLPLKQEFKVGKIEDFDLEKELKKDITPQYCVYIYATLHFITKETISYLRSVDMSDYQAVLHQFMK